MSNYKMYIVAYSLPKSIFEACDMPTKSLGTGLIAKRDRTKTTGSYSFVCWEFKKKLVYYMIRVQLNSTEVRILIVKSLIRRI